MPLDPNIILSGQQTKIDNPLDMATRALTMRDLAQRSQIQNQSLQDDQAMRSAIQRNSTVDASGKLQVNDGAVMSDLIKSGASTKAVEYHQTVLARQLQAQEQQRKQEEDNMKLGSMFFAQVRNDKNTSAAEKQRDWDLLRQRGARLGFPDLPPQYPGDPAVEQMKSRYKTIEERQKDRQLDIDAQKARATSVEAGLPDPGMMNVSGSAAAAIRQPGASAQPTAPRGSPSSAQPGALSALDPATLISRVPMKDRDKVAAEIKEQANIRNVAGNSLDAFDQAAKEVRPLTGGVMGTSGTAFVPGMESAAQKDFLGSAFTTVKGVEGSVRQAQFDAIKSKFMPQFGDSDSTIQSKRDSWINYLKSHSSAPLSKSYGIDLKKYASTSLPADMGKKSGAGDFSLQDLMAEKARRSSSGKQAGN